MAAPQALPRKQSMLKVLPGNAHPNNIQTNVNVKKRPQHVIHAAREVDLLNHCIDDVERFMGRLQQAAEARSAVEQSKKKERSKKKSNKKKQQYDLMSNETNLPSEQEFVDIFQKMKYSFSLLDRLKNEISNPSSEELLHHLFVPLDLMVKTTGGPGLAMDVSSPALTSGALTLLQQNLSQEESELWGSLGPNWTQSHSQHDKQVSPYTPVFLDGWQPKACDAEGHAFEDPVESQHKYEAQLKTHQFEPSQVSSPVAPTNENVENLPSEGGQLYRCSYDFVARNSSELSVLHGETLQVIDSTKRWWKCINSYDQIGFVPSNILEPVDHTEPDSHVVTRKPSMKVPLSPPGGGRFSYTMPSSSGENYGHGETRPHSMPPIGDEGERVMLVNNELAERLANGRLRPSVISRASETTASLNYHSSPGEVQEWLKVKGFGDHTVNSLGILSGAQLFSLNKEELCTVSPQEGARVFNQLTMQKVLMEKGNKSTELDAIMKKQKMKADPNTEGEF